MLRNQSSKCGGVTTVASQPTADTSETRSSAAQGCQMAHFQTIPTVLVHFENAFEWKSLKMFYDHMVCFVTTWCILLQIGIFCVQLLRNPHFGILCQEKSGNPASAALKPNTGSKKLGQMSRWQWHNFEECPAEQSDLMSLRKNRRKSPPKIAQKNVLDKVTR
jgi:hypothetical protein